MSSLGSKTCAFCGYLCEANALFCGHCGKQLDITEEVRPTITPGEYSQSRVTPILNRPTPSGATFYSQEPTQPGFYHPQPVRRSPSATKLLVVIGILGVLLIGAVGFAFGQVVKNNSQTGISTTPNPANQSGIPLASGSATPTLTPSPTPSSMMFDNFNNGIGGWGIIGNDVSYAQDNGNGVLRFNPPDHGPAEAYKDVGSAALSEFRGISLRINLHGATLVRPSDDSNYRTASALYLNQNGWKFVGLYNYIKNSFDGWQNVYIPLTDFTGFDKAASFSSLGFRFWLYKAGTIDVDDITFVS